MNLQPVDIVRYGAEVSLVCFRCGHRGPALNFCADLDGPPFKAYYCVLCAQELRAQMQKEALRA